MKAVLHATAALSNGRLELLRSARVRGLKRTQCTCRSRSSSSSRSSGVHSGVAVLVFVPPASDNGHDCIG